jgi:trehalose 6-phosphate phosphatase
MLVDRYPCVVVSGRSRTDVSRRLRGTGIGVVLGNHGLEPWVAPAGVADRVRAWRGLLDRRLAGMPGVVIEEKGLSIAIHYRRSRTKKIARQAIAAAALELPEVRVIGGKQVVNLIPEGAGHKGIALLRERDRAGCATAIFVGDDDTDEDVFALDEAERLLSIRIGRKRRSAADYYLARQADIDELIRQLVNTRGRAIHASRS